MKTKNYLIRFTLDDKSNGYAIVNATTTTLAQLILRSQGSVVGANYNIYSLEEYPLGYINNCCNPNTVLVEGITTKGPTGDRGPLGLRGIQGEKGDKGDNGIGITNIISEYIDNKLKLTFSLSNNTSKVITVDFSLYYNDIDRLNELLDILTTSLGETNKELGSLRVEYNNLVNTTLPTILGNIYTKSQVDLLLSNIDKTLYILVDSFDKLPTGTNINPNKIYIVPDALGSNFNIYKEYVYVNNLWELLGEFLTEVNLSNYWSRDNILLDTYHMLLRIISGSDIYVANLEQLTQPVAPTITGNLSVTTTTGAITFTITNNTPGAIINWKLVPTDLTNVLASGSTSDNTTVVNTTIDLNSLNSSATPLQILTTTTKNGLSTSTISYDIVVNRKLKNPTITPSGTIYDSSRNVTFNLSLSGVLIKYTTDNSSPTNSSNHVFNGGYITLNSTTTVKAVASLTEWVNSDVVTNTVAVNTKKMYYGVVNSIPTTSTEIESLNSIQANSFPRTVSTSGYGKVCLCYDSILGELTSIKDSNGTLYISDFSKFVIDGYNVYIMNANANQTDMSYTFSK